MMLLDADVLIWNLRGSEVARAFLRRSAPQGVLYVSALTIAEVEAGLRPDEERRASQLLEALEPLAVTPEIGLAAGRLRRRWAPSHGSGLVDCVLAATAEIHDLALATLNVKHFPMIRGLKPAFKP